MAFDRTQYLARVARMKRPGESITLELPSGESAKVRRLAPEEFLYRAVLPQQLALAAFRHYANGEQPASAITDEDILRIAELRAQIIAAVLVEPRIVPDNVQPQADELHYRDLGAEDATAIFDWATRREEAARLETFRAQQGVHSDGADGGEVRPASQRARRSKKGDARG